MNALICTLCGTVFPICSQIYEYIKNQQTCRELIHWICSRALDSVHPNIFLIVETNAERCYRRHLSWNEKKKCVRIHRFFFLYYPDVTLFILQHSARASSFVVQCLSPYRAFTHIHTTNVSTVFNTLTQTQPVIGLENLHKNNR